MIKAELIQKLEGKFYKVLTPAKQRDEAGVAWYVVGIYEKLKNGSMLRKNIGFYVENEGTKEEQAFWHSTEPNVEAVAPPETFATKLDVFIETKMANKTLSDMVVERVSEEHKVAVCTAYFLTADGVTERRIFISCDDEGKLQYASLK